MPWGASSTSAMSSSTGCRPQGPAGSVICDYLSREASRSNYAPVRSSRSAGSRWWRTPGPTRQPVHRYADGKGPIRDCPRAVRRPDRAWFAGPFVSGLAVDAEPSRPGRRGQGRTDPYRMDGHWRTDAVLRQPSLPHRGRGQLAGRPGRDAGRHRLVQHRRHAQTRRPVHTVLLAGGTLDLRAPVPPRRGARGRLHFHAVPPKFKGVGTFPVRAYATV